MKDPEKYVRENLHLSKEAGNHANTVFLFASTDNDGDGTLGIPIAAGGPFSDPSLGGYNFNFNLQGTLTAVPVPGAVWLFGSGQLGAGRRCRTEEGLVS